MAVFATSNNTIFSRLWETKFVKPPNLQDFIVVEGKNNLNLFKFFAISALLTFVASEILVGSLQ